MAITEDLFKEASMEFNKLKSKMEELFPEDSTVPMVTRFNDLEKYPYTIVYLEEMTNFRRLSRIVAESYAEAVYVVHLLVKNGVKNWQLCKRGVWLNVSSECWKKVEELIKEE